MASRPLIGITVDAAPERLHVGRAYVDLVTAAGGIPLLLPPCADHLDEYLARCEGFVLTGGDDPDMAPFGAPTHPRATLIDPARQAFETELLRRLDASRESPVLGVCLGMQLMALHAGGTLDQHLPDTLPTAAAHYGHRDHAVRGALGGGLVHSHHRQAITNSGVLAIVARADDEVIEAVRAEDRRFYLGVQWHPERTVDRALGAGLFEALVAACGR